MIEENEVKHIADLAKLEISESEIKKYQKQLTDIWNDIEKIVNVEIPDVDIMISPCINKNVYEEDKIGFHLSRENIFKNAKKVVGDYIAVVKVVE